MLEVIIILWIVCMPIAFLACCRITYDQFGEVDILLASLVGFSGPIGLLIGVLIKSSTVDPHPLSNKWRRLVLGKGRSQEHGSTTLL